MAWQDPQEIRIAASGEVYVAPVGTTLPTDPTTALPSEWVGLGLITTDGASLAVAPEIQDIMSWQSRQAVRRELINQEVTATFALQQWNEETIPLAFGGGEVTNPSGSVFRYELPTSGALDERAMVIDAIDGDVHQRWILPRGNVTDAVEVSMVRDAEQQLPIAFKALQPDDGGTSLIYLSDDAAAFAAGS